MARAAERSERGVIIACSLGLCATAASLTFSCASQPIDEPRGAAGSLTGGSSGAGSGGAAADGGRAAAGSTALGGAAGAPITHPGTVLLDAVHVSSDAEAEHFQRATTEVDFGEEPVARATLFVELESPCFPFDKWTRESIPAGHNWPEKCDAFDRGFELALDEPDAGTGGPPGLELGRAITPFGGPLSMQFDVTDAVNGLPGKHQFSVKIGTWPDPEGKVSGAKGEWIVSAWLQRELGIPPRRVLAVVPLAYGSEAMASRSAIAFEVPSGAGSARIDYRVTGHGAASAGAHCIGPAEEFCRRQHSLYVDGELIDEFEPWRSDCATLCHLEHYESSLLSVDYCAENPCGATSSVRASRANWCPGSVTDAHAVEASVLAMPGSHEFSWSIDQLVEGGSWLLSATYYAFE